MPQFRSETQAGIHFLLKTSQFIALLLLSSRAKPRDLLFMASEGSSAAVDSRSLRYASARDDNQQWDEISNGMTSTTGRKSVTGPVAG